MYSSIFNFDNSYASLPHVFHRHVKPVSVAHPRLVALNQELAGELCISSAAQHSSSLAEILAGNVIPPGAEPIAMAYAGHQFGHFVPQLGDGRAVLLGEVMDTQGRRRDLQLKGSGRTPFSRSGDGRAALGPVIREYILSEAMHALGIPTTRSLAVVTTGEPVYRETVLPGAVLTRVAFSHIRIGTFEYFAAQGDMNAVQLLADYAIARLYPAAGTSENPYLSLLEQVLEAQALLVAKWMGAGFIHGVMNTDNMAISGETLDYGPCAFMDHYDPAAVFSAIDMRGRYAFENQPAIAAWNLARLAETLLPLLASDAKDAAVIAAQALSRFPALFKNYWLAGMRKKTGLLTPQENDAQLIGELLGHMHASGADYTLAFRALCDAAETKNEAALLQLFPGNDAFGRWLKSWRERIAAEPESAGERSLRMRQANPAYIPRNHLVEEAIAAAVEREDFTVMEQLSRVLAHPYDPQEAFARYALAPLPGERVYKTFCGT